jgi:hypothetical protein
MRLQLVTAKHNLITTPGNHSLSRAYSHQQAASTMTGRPMNKLAHPHMSLKRYIGP